MTSADLVELLIKNPTPEDLHVEFVYETDGAVLVREVGGLGIAIYEYRFRGDVCEEDISFLLSRLEELTQQLDGMRSGSPTSIELARVRRDRKRAARRLRRWMEEHDPQVLEIPERFHAIVEEALKKASDAPPAMDQKWLAKRIEEGAAGDLYAYDLRRLEHPPLLITSLPSAMRHLLDEAREAYCHGLFRASVAVCRALVEDALDRAADRADVLPIKKAIRPLASALLLSADAKAQAYQVADTGNQAMHSGERQFVAKEAWQTLMATINLVRYLCHQGYLGGDEPSQ